MGFKINFVTGEVEIDYKLVEDSIKGAKALADKIADVHRRSKIKEFLEPREFLASNRKLATILAQLFYRGPGLKILDEKVPILYQDECIPPTPIDLGKVKLEWQSRRNFDFDKSIFSKNDILPFGEKRYSSPLNEFVEGINLFDAPTYRLMGTEKTEENDYVLKFGLDTYFNYVNTCELLAYEFCKEIMRRVKDVRELSADFIKNKAKLRLRSQARDPFDFTNRSAAAGINTMLIVMDNKKPSTFYLHHRSDRVAECMNTISVVPAGTFQPRAERDSFHSQDFNLYTNLMREFAEELLGKEELNSTSKMFTDIFEIDLLKKINFFIKQGIVRAYYLGMGLDCLTTKPEIFTALIFERETIDTFLWQKFVDCDEGETFEVEFSPQQLRSGIEDDEIVPAGAACLWLVEKNFDFFYGRG